MRRIAGRALGADVWQVRELVNKSPYRDMHLPGAGVGGHCLPKDPWLLIANAGDAFRSQVVPAARAVNDGMPLHVADITVQALREAGHSIREARVAVLGQAYLENSGDARHSPSATLTARLRELGAQVVVHDPWIADYQGDLWERVSGCDAAVLMVRHRAYCDLDLSALKAALRTPILIDGRHVFDAAQVEAAGLVYRGVGRGVN
jgi:UDP-N-acetyl-D-mannosaminuronic acid dehydrogenase